MGRFLHFVVIGILACVTDLCRAEDMIVFTANQGWLSRIYALEMDGTVITHHEYEYYIFSDVERQTVLPSGVTDWASPDGVGAPDANWTYSVVAVDDADHEIQRSNRVGEFDFALTIPAP